MKISQEEAKERVKLKRDIRKYSGLPLYKDIRKLPTEELIKLRDRLVGVKNEK